MSRARPSLSSRWTTAPAGSRRLTAIPPPASIRHGAAVEAHSPLGHGQGQLLDDAVLRRLAAARDKTRAQIVLRWHLQHGRSVFPKSVHRERMQENLKVFDFTLLPDEVSAIDALDRGEKGRVGPHPDTFAAIPE